MQGGEAALEILEAALRLVEAEQSAAPLQVLLDEAASVTARLEDYVPAAVQQAREAGMGWQDVAGAAGVTVAAARGRWNAARVARRLGSPAHALPAAGGPAGGRRERLADDGAAAARLGRALAFLQRVSGLSAVDVVRRSGLDPALVSQVLSGQGVPAWPELGLIASALGGRPADLRGLWEQAVGRAPSLEQGGGTSPSLHRWLRGLYLAAACPAAGQLSARTRGSVPEQSVTAVLQGTAVPDWETARHLILALDADPAGIELTGQDTHRTRHGEPDRKPIPTQRRNGAHNS